MAYLERPDTFQRRKNTKPKQKKGQFRFSGTRKFSAAPEPCRRFVKEKKKKKKAKVAVQFVLGGCSYLLQYSCFNYICQEKRYFVLGLNCTQMPCGKGESERKQ